MGKKKCNVENELYILPSANEEMKTFAKNFKVDMMEHVVKSIQFAVDNKLNIAEVFQFKNSSFVVTISENEFESNLENINQYYMDNNLYELCQKIDVLRKRIKYKYKKTISPKKRKSSSS